MTLLIKHNGVFAPVSDAQGASGVIHAGTGTPPAGTGLTGDYYHSTDLERLYGPKGSDEAWGAPSAPVFRAKTSRTSAGTLDAPAGTQVGDLLVLFGSFYSLTMPGEAAGFTTLYADVHDSWRQRVSYKIATQADIDSGVAVTTPDGNQTIWSLFAFDSVDVGAIRGSVKILDPGGTGSMTAADGSAISHDPDTLAVYLATAYTQPGDPGAGYTTLHTGGGVTSVYQRVVTAAVTTDVPRPVFSKSGNAGSIYTLVLEPEVVTTYVDLSDREVTQAELDALAGRVTTLESAPVAEVTQAELDAVENKIIGRLLAGSGAPAALSFVGAATGSAEFTTSASMTIPASAQVGDIMFVAARSNDGATASVSTHALTESGESTSTEKLWYRVLQAGDPGSTLTVTFSATGFQVAALAVLRGQGAAAIAEHAATATLTAPSLNLAAGTTVLEVYFSKRDNSTISGGAGTIRATRSNSRTQVQINERAGLLSGPTTGGTAVTSGSSTQWGTRAIAIAIAPSAISIAVDGDFYLDKTNRLLYGPMTAGAWGTAMPLDEVTQAELDAAVAALDARLDTLEAGGGGVDSGVYKGVYGGPETVFGPDTFAQVGDLTPYVLTDNATGVEVKEIVSGLTGVPGGTTTGMRVRGGGVGDSWIERIVTLDRDGTISFHEHAETESPIFDNARFSIDGVEQYARGGTGLSWMARSYSLAAGTHTLRWTIDRDGSGVAGYDGFTITDVLVTQAALIVAGDLLRDGDGALWQAKADSPQAAPVEGSEWTLVLAAPEVTQAELDALDTRVDTLEAGSGPGAVAAGGAALALLSTTPLTAATGARVVDMDTTVRADSGFTVDLAANSITVTEAGWYALFGHVRFSAAQVNNHVLTVLVNGDGGVRGDQINAATLDLEASGVAYLAAGDVLTLSVYTGSSSSVVGNALGNYTLLRAVRLVQPEVQPIAAFLFTDEGALVVVTGTTRIYNDSGRTLTILGVRATLGTAGSTDTVVDVNKGGTTLFTTQANRPTLATGVDTDLAVPDVTAWENGTYLTVDIDSAGTGAADLIVQVSAQ